MRILVLASEMVPYAKTGGLADVVGALPRALAARGHDVRVIIPRYRCIDPERWALRIVMPEIWINFPGRHIEGRILGTLYAPNLPRKGRAREKHLQAIADENPVTVYFVDSPPLFDRPGLYGEDGRDYGDNPDRFAFFNMAAVWLIKALNWKPDIIHCNDWQTAFLPVFLRAQAKYRYDRFFSKTRILFSIHNLAYQGLCDFGLLERIGLSPALFQAESMEYWETLSPMKGGIAYSDWISTVSPTYAGEILTQRFGCGIEGFLGTRASRLSGILNGIDTDEWDPETDPLLAANYSADDLAGKTECKEALCKTLRWPDEPDTPFIAMINRLDGQKGIDLLLEAVPHIAKLGARLVVLGSGRADYENRLREMAKRYPKNLRVRIGFDLNLAHRIEAGADAFLMLSHYEPCGLNQMFSLRYGTLPIVHHTGGLADTVRNATPPNLTDGSATGFHFFDHNLSALMSTLQHALWMFRNEPASWRAMQQAGMRCDLSWDRSAQHYEGLFQHLLSQPSPLLPTAL